MCGEIKKKKKLQRDSTAVAFKCLQDLAPACLSGLEDFLPSPTCGHSTSSLLSSPRSYLQNKLGPQYMVPWHPVLPPYSTHHICFYFSCQSSPAYNRGSCLSGTPLPLMPQEQHLIQSKCLIHTWRPTSPSNSFTVPRGSGLTAPFVIGVATSDRTRQMCKHFSH